MLLNIVIEVRYCKFESSFVQLDAVRCCFVLSGLVHRFSFSSIKQRGKHGKTISYS
jgi:hypothetical protein